MDTASTPPQCADPSRRGRRLGAPAHGQVTPSRPPGRSRATCVRGPKRLPNAPPSTTKRGVGSIHDARAVTHRNGMIPGKHQDFVPLLLGPQIREGWKVSEIGEEVDAVGGATPSTKEPAYWNEGEQHWATPKDLSRSYCRQCCWKRTGRSPTRAWGLSRSGVKNYSKRGRWSRK